MSNVIYAHVKSFFAVPSSFVLDGHLRAAPPKAVCLYIFLLHCANHHTAVKFQFSHAELKAYVGDEKSVRVARDWLRKANLITFKKCQPGVYEYALLIPGTSEQIPPPKNRRGKRLYDATAPLPAIERPRSAPKASAENSERTADYTKGLACPGCGGPYRTGANGESVCPRCRADSVPVPKGSQPMSAKDVGF